MGRFGGGPMDRPASIAPPGTELYCARFEYTCNMHSKRVQLVIGEAGGHPGAPTSDLRRRSTSASAGFTR